MRQIYSVFLVFCILGSPRVAMCTSEFPVQVPQPIAVEEGIFISTVTFVRFLGSVPPGFKAQLVTKESCVADELGRCVNRNAANLIGIRAGFDPIHGPGALVGDTLRVFIDLGGVVGEEEAKSLIKGWSVKATVEATIECVLAAAYASRRGWNPDLGERMEARYVELEVRGHPEYTGLGGVFEFDTLGELPRQRRFN